MLKTLANLLIFLGIVSGGITLNATTQQTKSSAQKSYCSGYEGYGEISSETGRPKTVHVKPYHRKDGTYVEGHYRSPPK